MYITLRSESSLVKLKVQYTQVHVRTYMSSTVDTSSLILRTL